MKRLFSIIFVTFFFIYSPLFFQNAVEAAYLKFNTTTVTTNVNQTFTIEVIVDAGTDQITSTDIWVIYDPVALEAQSVSSGTFFPAVTHNITSGKVSITGLIVDPGTYKTGSGTVATITFKSLKTGTSNLSFDCRTEVSNSSKIIQNDVNATNIINCSQNIGATVNSGVSSSSQSNSAYPTSSLTPTALPRSGIFENMAAVGGAGFMLLLIAGLLRMVL